MAGRLVLSFVPMSFFINIFFKIVGAKIGKNVRINSWFLNDAYLLEIGDNVFIGGKTDVSCHTFENNVLILKNVKIGANSTIGQRCYISPGATIGDHSVIGQYCFIRKNKTIPPHSGPFHACRHADSGRGAIGKSLTPVRALFSMSVK